MPYCFITPQYEGISNGQTVSNTQPIPLPLAHVWPQNFDLLNYGMHRLHIIVLKDLICGAAVRNH